MSVLSKLLPHYCREKFPFALAKRSPAAAGARPLRQRALRRRRRVSAASPACPPTVVAGNHLLRQLRHLAGGFQQVELPLLASKIGVQERQPLIIFVELRGFHVAQAGATLLEL